jgi:8-oxo-dGTP diphosphatase
LDDRVRVVCGALVRGGRVLVARRGPGMRHAGAWELPGGKVEPGEDDATALRRELREELSVNVQVGRWLGVSVLGRVELVAYVCRSDESPCASEHDALRWLGPDHLGEVAWAEADRPLLAALADELRSSHG